MIHTPNGFGRDTDAGDGHSPSLWRVGFVGVLVLAGALFFGRLGERALWSEEVRWAQIPREMLASGDYFWPTINGVSYYDKPLGSYWLVLLAAFLTGGMDETAARLPSAAAGVLAVAMLMLIARRLYDERTSLLAGIVLTSSFGFVVFARTASADVETIAGVLVALWLCLRQPDGGRATLAAWVVMALTALTKGLLGFALPLLIFSVYRWACTTVSEPAGWLKSQRWLFNWATPAAIVIAAGIYLTPFLISRSAIGSSQGLSMVWRENVQRFFAAHNHRGPVYLYAYVLFGLAAPWAVLLPASLIQAHASRSNGDRFALAFFWSIFVFFTLASSRRSYYLLPILPAAALVIARLLSTSQDAWAVWARRLAKFGFGVALLAFAIGGLPLVVPSARLPAPWNELPPLPGLVCFGALWTTGAILLTKAAWRFSTESLALALAVIALGTMAYLFLIAQPELERYRTYPTFVASVRDRLDGRLDQLVLYRAREAVYALEALAPLAEAHTLDDLRPLLRSRQFRWVLARERDLPALALDADVIAREPAQPWEGDEARASKLVLVRIHR